MNALLRPPLALLLALLLFAHLYGCRGAVGRLATSTPQAVEDAGPAQDAGRIEGSLPDGGVTESDSSTDARTSEDPVPPTGFFAAVHGSAAGDGSFDDPWNLETAFGA